MNDLYKYLKLRPFHFLSVVWVTTAWFKCRLSVNISTCDGTTWQCCMPHCIVIHWKLWIRTIFLVCCHVPVQQNAWRKPNGLNFKNARCKKKEILLYKIQFQPILFSIHGFQQNEWVPCYCKMIFFSWLKHKVYKWWKVWYYHSISFHFI